MTTFKKSTVNHFSEKTVNNLIDNITYMIDLVTCYGGSAEVEWAYRDFRKALYNMLANTSVNTTFTAEDKQKIGKAICKAIKSNHKEVKRDMRGN